MPAGYAHHRFGRQAVEIFPAQAQRSIRQFRRLYDAGLQGPDIFFYHNILFRDKIVALGKNCHNEGGEDFFTRCIGSLTAASGEAAQAYLWGVLAHYCLDSVMHPFVLEQTADEKITHVELETEFDRFLMQLDGIRQPASHNRGSQLKLTDGECVTAALFYPATPGAVRRSIKNTAFLHKLLSLPNGSTRRIVEWGAGEKLRQHFIQRTPNKSCIHLNEPMLELYDRALSLLPEMTARIEAHMASGEPLGELFENTFNG